MKKIKQFAPFVVILLIIAAIVFYLTQVAAEEGGPLTASGTVEAVDVDVSSELGGRVEQITAEEGDRVQQGELLIQFDDDALQAELEQAEAALKQAQAKYDLTAMKLSPENRQAAIAAAQLELVNAQQALDKLYEDVDVARAAAQQAVANGRDAVRDAQERVDNLQVSAPQTDIEQAEANVTLARDELEDAIDDYEPYEDKPETNLTRATYLSRKAQAQENYDDAVRLLNNLKSVGDEIDLAQAEADLAAAEAALADARREYDDLAEGPDPEALAVAQARLDNAQAQLDLAQAGGSKEELAVAQAQIDTAQAAVNAIKVQLSKLTLEAPMSGTILYRAVEPGEVVKPGAPVLTIADLENLTITVYVPEDRYGEIVLGQTARVTANSFPDETFQATVVRIAEEAEFTPRNVQTAEGRRATVFAVKLAVSDPGGKLKPGMPADVVFGGE